MNICSDLNRRRIRLFSAMPNDQFLDFTRSEVIHSRIEPHSVPVCTGIWCDSSQFLATSPWRKLSLNK
jgi:hypothetical protein